MSGDLHPPFTQAGTDFQQIHNTQYTTHNAPIQITVSSDFLSASPQTHTIIHEGSILASPLSNLVSRGVFFQTL